MVRLLLHHLLILFPGIGSSTTLHPRDVYFSSLLFCFWGLVFLPAILFLHLGCTDIGYCIYDIYGLWIVFVVCVYALCMGMCLWLCVWICIYGYMYGYVFMDFFYGLCLWLRVWVCVYGSVYGHRVMILRKARFIKHRGLLLHKAVLDKCWDLFLHEAHFSNSWVLLFHEAHLNVSSNFSNFPPENGKNFAPVYGVK